MSTSDRPPLPATAPQFDRPGGALHALEGLPAGFPDVAEIARMAGELFAAMPVAPHAFGSGPSLNPNPQGALPGPALPAAPLGVLAAAAPPLGGVPRFAGNDAPQPSRGFVAPSHPPVVPSAVDAPGLPSTGSFQFLEEARPLFGDRTPSAQAAHTVPAAQPPAGLPAAQAAPDTASTRSAYEAARLEELPVMPDSNAKPSEAANFAQPPTPAVPASFGFIDSSHFAGFSFLEEGRPLFSSGPSSASSELSPQKAAQPTRLGPVPAAAKDAPRTNSVSSPEYPGAPGPNTSDYGSYLFLQESRPFGGVGSAPQVQAQTVATPHASEDVPQALSLSSYPFEVEAIRRDFPILQERVNGHPLVWFDNAATTQKPQSVIDRLSYFYAHENSNVHRAAHELAARATDAYESAREKTRRFLNAGTVKEVVFVRGATEAINLVAQSWGRQNIRKDDEIVITWLEHHANIVPWQMLCTETGARLRVAPVDEDGQILLDEYEKLLGPKTRLVSISQVSNALGTITPVEAMIESAHRHGARVLVDGAQSVSHMKTDVQALDCDFFVFSGHKVFAPTGIGVLYGKAEVLEHMPPWQGGGNMIQDVTLERALYQQPPQRFEAGTGNIADAVGLGAAIDYLDRVGMANISKYEHSLLVYATAAVSRIPGLHIIGTAKEKASVLSFVLDGYRTEEIGDYLNRKGIAVRSGHHCAQPILRRFGLESSLRVSLAFYNTCQEIDTLVAALWDLREGRAPGVV